MIWYQLFYSKIPVPDKINHSKVPSFMIKQAVYENKLPLLARKEIAHRVSNISLPISEIIARWDAESILAFVPCSESIPRHHYVYRTRVFS